MHSYRRQGPKHFTPQASQPALICINALGSTEKGRWSPEGNWIGEESWLPASMEPENSKLMQHSTIRLLTSIYQHDWIVIYASFYASKLLQ